MNIENHDLKNIDNHNRKSSEFTIGKVRESSEFTIGKLKPRLPQKFWKLSEIHPLYTLSHFSNPLSMKIQNEFTEALARRRDPEMEKDLQDAIDRGSNVWVIGDIHGHGTAFEMLLDILELSEDDRIVALGDLIDRGTESAKVVGIIRDDPRFYSLMGNHENIAVMGLHQTLRVFPTPGWLYIGGKPTVESYGYTGAFLDEPPKDGSKFRNLGGDLFWMARNPLECVLDEWRLVHAGYNPLLTDEEQSSEDLCWIRSKFYENPEPFDLDRTIVFGHTPTLLINGEQGEPAVSDTELVNGMPAWIGIDTSIYAWEPGLLCAFNLTDHRFIFANEDGGFEAHLGDLEEEITPDEKN